MRLTLPEDVKRRFPSLRQWGQLIVQRLESITQEIFARLETEIERLEDLIHRVKQDSDSSYYWVTNYYSYVPPNARVMSRFRDGYVKIKKGEPATISVIPDWDIYREQKDVTADNEINWSHGTLFYVELNGNTALTFRSTITGKEIIVIVKQNATTAYACTWPVDVLWPGGTEPDLTTVGLGSTNIFTFIQYETNMAPYIVGYATLNAS